MYNEKRKMQYLEEKRRSASISNNLGDEFRAAERFEEKLEKDLCEWDSPEIIDFYRWHATPYIQALVAINNALEGYTTWCIANGLVKDNQNHYSEIKTAALCECIDYKKLASMIFTRQKLLEDISALPNASDRYMILGLFEGIPFTHNILYNTKISDIDTENSTIQLSNGRRLSISSELIWMAQRAAAEEKYINMKTQKEYNLFDTGTIIKPIMYYQDRFTKEPERVVSKRFRSCREYLGWEDVSIPMIRESGRISWLKQKSEESGLPISEVISKYRQECEEIFGDIQNITAYLATYIKASQGG